MRSMRLPARPMRAATPRRPLPPPAATAAVRARPTVQCGAGWVSGTPGASTSAEIRLQSIWRRSSIGMPAARALSRLPSVSSNATTSAPPASSALALASPDAPRPNSATFLPANVVTGIMRALFSPPPAMWEGERAALFARPGSSQLQRREAREREHDRDDPEADHDLRLGPALLLGMVMQRRHAEHALARQLG